LRISTDAAARDEWLTVVLWETVMTANVFDSVPLPARAYRIKEFCRLYGVSKTKAYDLIAQGKLASILIGRRRLIPADAAEKLLEGAE